MAASRRRVAALGLVLGLAGAAFGPALVSGGADSPRRAPSAASGSQEVASVTAAAPGSVLEQLEQRLGVRPGSRVEIGAFALARGRTLRLYTVEAEHGGSCLVDRVGDDVVGSTCLGPGLFRARRAAFSVNSDGGPERFGELHLVGVAAPGIVSLEVALTDGSTTAVELNEARAFLYEATPAELARDALPAALRLYGRGGRLVETISIPALR